MSAPRWLLLAPLLILGPLGCTDTPTQVLVHVEADPGVAARADGVRVRIFGVGTDYDESPANFAFPLTIPVLPQDGDGSRRFHVEAAALEGAAVLAIVRAETGFIDGELRHVWLRLEDACVGALCTSTSSCREGSCAPLCVAAGPEDGPRPSLRTTCDPRIDVDGGTPLDSGGDAEIDGGAPPDGARVDGGSDGGDADVDGGATCGTCPCSGDRCEDGVCVPATPADDVALGPNHGCAISSDARLFCWGTNDEGQVGTGDRVDRPTPVLVHDATGVLDVSLGPTFTLMLADDGRVWSWGAEDRRQLGQGSGAAALDGPFIAPEPFKLRNAGGQLLDTDGEVTDVAADAVLDPHQYSGVGAGGNFSCAMSATDARRLYCWGDGVYLQLGFNDFSGTQVPIPRAISQVDGATVRDWLRFDLGSRHACAIREMGSQEMRCWGSNGGGRLGAGPLTPMDPHTGVDDAGQTFTSRPMLVMGGLSWSRVSAGYRSTCGVTLDGELYCWGNNAHGQLGAELEDMYPSTPQRIGETSDWTDVSVGEFHGCGLRGDALYCWGSNTDGRAVPGGADEVLLPTQIAGPWTGVDTETLSTCALTPAGAVYCWGNPSTGRLGLGSELLTPPDTPQRVCLPAE